MIGDKYPYTNLYTLNLDWLFDKIKEIESAGGEVSEELEKIISGEIAVGNATHAVSADSADHATKAEQSANGSDLDTAASQAASADAGVEAFADGSAIVKKAEQSANGSDLDTAAANAANALNKADNLISGGMIAKKAERDSNNIQFSTSYVRFVNGVSPVAGNVTLPAPTASGGAGVVKVSPVRGIALGNIYGTGDDTLLLMQPSNAQIDNRNNAGSTAGYYAINLNMLDYAVLKAIVDSHLTLTSAQQQAAQSWLGVSGGGTASEVDSSSVYGSVKINRGNIEIRGAGIANKYVLIDSSGFTLVDETDPESPQPLAFKTWTAFFT